MPIVHMFCFICSQQWVKNISLCQNYGFISSLFKKLFLIIQPLIFCRWHKNLFALFSIEITLTAFHS